MARAAANAYRDVIGTLRADAGRRSIEPISTWRVGLALSSRVAHALVEIYGPNVYLPRFPNGLTIERIDTRPTKSRNPLPGVTEKQDRLGATGARRPRWVVVGMGFAWRYLQDDARAELNDGRVLRSIQRAGLADMDTKDYVRGLFAEEADYAKVHVSHYARSSFLPPRPLHASLATDVFIFERR